VETVLTLCRMRLPPATLLGPTTFLLHNPGARLTVHTDDVPGVMRAMHDLADEESREATLLSCLERMDVQSYTDIFDNPVGRPGLPPEDQAYLRTLISQFAAGTLANPYCAMELQLTAALALGGGGVGFGMDVVF